MPSAHSISLFGCPFFAFPIHYRGSTVYFLVDREIVPAQQKPCQAGNLSYAGPRPPIFVVYIPILSPLPLPMIDIGLGFGSSSCTGINIYSVKGCFKMFRIQLGSSRVSEQFEATFYPMNTFNPVKWAYKYTDSSRVKSQNPSPCSTLDSPLTATR